MPSPPVLHGVSNVNNMESDSLSGWIARNLSNAGAGTPLAVHYNSFRLRALPVMLIIAAIVLAGMWFQKERLELVTLADRVAYPLMVLACLGGRSAEIPARQPT